MITCVDIECTFKTEIHNGKRVINPMPWVGNQLVSVGYLWTSPTGHLTGSNYLCFYHNEQPPSGRANILLQEILDTTKLLVAHNAKFDLLWLRECGFTYNGAIYDTMLTEYVINRSRMRPLSLAECLKRRHLDPKRTDLTEDYLQKGIGFDKMPWDVVEEYGKADVSLTMQLAKAQLEELGATFDDFI